MSLAYDDKDLEYGDSLDTQAKKQKMAKRVHGGEPMEEVGCLRL